MEVVDGAYLRNSVVPRAGHPPEVSLKEHRNREGYLEANRQRKAADVVAGPLHRCK